MTDRLRAQQEFAAQLIADLRACIEELELDVAYWRGIAEREISSTEQCAERAETLGIHLQECVNQLEYQHEKFGGTGSGDAVLTRARDALKWI